MEDKNIQKELEELAPFLEEIKRQRNQSVPENYFDALNQKILSQTIDNKPVKAKKSFLFAFAKIAAIGILLIGTTWIIKPYFSTHEPTALEPISQEEIFSYMDENIDDITEDELIILLDESDLATTSIDSSLLDQINLDDIDEELLEEYIEIQL